IEESEYQQQKITRAQYVMVGQLCVAKGWRGHGLVAAMYQYFRQQYAQQFLYCCTDVSVQNERSLKAHHRCGFQDINTLQYGGEAWRIVLWPWRGAAK
ncbi:MAG: hypothetical protein MUF62_05015, partial [Chitinophagaceae bacterium]|nr:hypothetical protein [Chitinophagaceae bacterium]